MKLPIGVADLDSLGELLSPSRPSHAGTVGPLRAHPPDTLCHACSVAVVLAAPGATTVSTCRALPVGLLSGRRCTPDAWCCAVGRVEPGAGTLVGRRVGVPARLEELVGAGVAGVVAALDVGRVVAAEEWCRGVADVEQAAAASVTTPRASTDIRRPVTGPGCHEWTPMRMRGCADGVSQRSRLITLLCATDTQPAVDEPSLTCRKNALPFG